MHILGYLTSTDLDRHWEFVQKDESVLDQILWSLGANTENPTTLVAFDGAVLDHKCCIIQRHTKPSFRILKLAILKSERISFVSFVMHALDPKIVAFVFTELIAIDKNSSCRQVLY